MSFRLNEREPFDPSRHIGEPTSFVRRSAIDNDKLAETEAVTRNKLKHFWNKKISGIDIVHERAIGEYIKDLQVVYAEKGYLQDPVAFDYPVRIFGKIFGKPVDLNLYDGTHRLIKQISCETSQKTDLEPISPGDSTLDGEVIAKKEAKKYSSGYIK